SWTRGRCCRPGLAAVPCPQARCLSSRAGPDGERGCCLRCPRRLRRRSRALERRSWLLLKQYSQGCFQSRGAGVDTGQWQVELVGDPGRLLCQLRGCSLGEPDQAGVVGEVVQPQLGVAVQAQGLDYCSVKGPDQVVG